MNPVHIFSTISVESNGKLEIIDAFGVTPRKYGKSDIKYVNLYINGMECILFDIPFRAIKSTKAIECMWASLGIIVKNCVYNGVLNGSKKGPLGKKCQKIINFITNSGLKCILAHQYYQKIDRFNTYEINDGAIMGRLNISHCYISLNMNIIHSLTNIMVIFMKREEARLGIEDEKPPTRS